jgi:hypothetical protein
MYLRPHINTFGNERIDLPVVPVGWVANTQTLHEDDGTFRGEIVTVKVSIYGTIVWYGGVNSDYNLLISDHRPVQTSDRTVLCNGLTAPLTDQQLYERVVLDTIDLALKQKGLR